MQEGLALNARQFGLLSVGQLDHGKREEVLRRVIGQEGESRHGRGRWQRFRDAASAPVLDSKQGEGSQ